MNEMKITNESIAQAIIEIIKEQEAYSNFIKYYDGYELKEIELFLNKMFRYIKFDLDYDLEEEIYALLGAGSIFYTDESESASHELYMFLSGIEFKMKKAAGFIKDEANNE
jgi:hypothetical protein